MAYPATIDTMQTVTSGQTLAQAVHSDRHNEVATTVNAIQTELGLNPSGGSATVVARFDALDTLVALKAPSASPTFTGVQANASGTAALPSITFTGDLDTGIYRPAANQVAITTNGAAGLTVSSGGQVDVAGNLIAVGTIAGSGLAGSLLSSTTPSALGTATAGTSTTPARADHVHSPNSTNATLTTPTINGGTADSLYLISPSEKITISATAATGTINFDAISQTILYYTTNASANFTLNFRGDGTNTLNSIINTGEAITVVFMNTNGATAYYASAFQIDGSSVTPKWSGGTAPSSGSASSIDAYSFTIIKTGSAAFTVLASVGKFA